MNSEGNSLGEMIGKKSKDWTSILEKLCKEIKELKILDYRISLNGQFKC